MAIKLSMVRKVAKLQCTQAEACSVLGISTAKFKKLLETDPRVRKAWEEGIEEGKLSIRRKQMRLAETNAQMAIHLGKQYLGQVDSKNVQLTGANGGPVETVDLSRLTRDERKQLRDILTKSEPATESTG